MHPDESTDHVTAGPLAQANHKRVCTHVAARATPHSLVLAAALARAQPCVKASGAGACPGPGRKNGFWDSLRWLWAEMWQHVRPNVRGRCCNSRTHSFTLTLTWCHKQVNDSRLTTVRSMCLSRDKPGAVRSANCGAAVHDAQSRTHAHAPPPPFIWSVAWAACVQASCMPHTAAAQASNTQPRARPTTQTDTTQSQ